MSFSFGASTSENKKEHSSSSNTFSFGSTSGDTSFGSLPDNQSKTSGGLFGASGGTTAPTSKNLFGGTSSTTQPAGNLFSSPQPSSGNLFSSSQRSSGSFQPEQSGTSGFGSYEQTGSDQDADEEGNSGDEYSDNSPSENSQDQYSESDDENDYSEDEQEELPHKPSSPKPTRPTFQIATPETPAPRSPTTTSNRLGRSPTIGLNQSTGQASFGLGLELSLAAQQQQDYEPQASLPAYAARGREYFVYYPETGKLGVGSLESLKKQTTKQKSDKLKGLNIECRDVPCFPLLPPLGTGRVVSMSVNANGTCVLVAGIDSISLIRLPQFFSSSSQPNKRDGVSLTGTFDPESNQVNLSRNTSVRFSSSIGGAGGDDETSYAGLRSLGNQARLGMSGKVEKDSRGLHKFRGEFSGLDARFELCPENEQQCGDNVFEPNTFWHGHCDIFLPGLPRKTWDIRMDVTKFDGKRLECSLGEVVVELVDDWLFGGHSSTCSIVQVEWHPSSSHLVIVLTTDNTIRMYDIRRDLDSPVIEVNLGDPEDVSQVVSFVFAARDTHSKLGSAVSYQIWRRLGVFVLRENGEILMLCPFTVGGGDVVPVSSSEASTLLCTLKEHMKVAQDSGDQQTISTLKDQIEWTNALLNSFPASTPRSLSTTNEVKPNQLLLSNVPEKDDYVLVNHNALTISQNGDKVPDLYKSTSEETEDEENPLYRLPCVQVVSPPCKSPSERHQQQSNSFSGSIAVSATRDSAFISILRSWSCGRVDVLLCSSPIEAYWGNTIAVPVKTTTSPGNSVPNVSTPNAQSATNSTPHTTPKQKVQAPMDDPGRPERLRTPHPSPMQLTLSQRIHDSVLGSDSSNPAGSGRTSPRRSQVHSTPNSHHKLGLTSATLQAAIANESKGSEVREEPQSLYDDYETRAIRNPSHLVYCLEVVNGSMRCDSHLEFFPDLIFADVVYCLDTSSGALYSLHITWFNALSAVVAARDQRAQTEFVKSCDWKLSSRMVLPSVGRCQTSAESYAVITEPGLGHWLLGPTGNTEVLNCVDLSVEISRLRTAAEQSSEREDGTTTPATTGNAVATKASMGIQSHVEILKQALNRFTVVPEQLRGLQLDINTPGGIGVAASEWLVGVSHALLHGSGGTSQSEGESVLHGLISGYEKLSNRRKEQERSMEHQHKLLNAVFDDLNSLRNEREDLKDMAIGMSELQALTNDAVESVVARAQELRPTMSAAQHEYLKQVRLMATRSKQLMQKIGLDESHNKQSGLVPELSRLIDAEEAVRKLSKSVESNPERLRNPSQQLSSEQEECIRGMQEGTEKILSRMLGLENGGKVISLPKAMDKLKTLRKQVEAVMELGVGRDGIVVLVAVDSDQSRILSEDLQRVPGTVKLQVQRRIMAREYQSKVRRSLGVDAIDCPYQFRLGDPQHTSSKSRRRTNVHVVLLDHDIVSDEVEDLSPQGQERGAKVVKIWAADTKVGDVEFEQVNLVQHQSEPEPVTLCEDVSQIIDSVSKMLQDASLQSGPAGSVFRRVC